jgi:ribonuclease HI
VPAKRNQRQQLSAAVPISVLNAHTLQVDAGCFPDGFTTFGCVFKDGPANVYFSACKKEELTTDPVVAEALAIRWCLQLAKEKGLHDFRIQSDALALVECFRGSNSLACNDLIIADCKSLMNEFGSVSVNYVSRNLNELAHRLVGYAMQNGGNSWNGYAFLTTVSSTVCISSFI